MSKVCLLVLAFSYLYNVDSCVIGNWKGSMPVPEQSLEIRERQFSGGDKELFLNFLRRIFRWLPEERPTAEELAYDDFLMQPIISDA